MNAFVHEKRAYFTPLQRARAFAEAEGKCASCGHKIKVGEDWDLDHTIALENGGTNDPDNLQVLCELCHAKKTGEDHSTASKSKRIYARHVVPRSKRKSRWNWRGS